MPHTYIWAGLLMLGVAAGCGALLPKPAPPPDVFSLDSGAVFVAPPTTAATAPTGAAVGTTLIVDLPTADAGFDSAHIVYLRTAGRPQSFARSEWIDTPARMLQPLIVRAAAESGAFAAVVAAPSAAAGNVRLETEIVRLQQDFGVTPSEVRFTLRAYLIRETTRQVLAWQEFDAVVAAGSDTPKGGAQTARQAVSGVLGQLAAFCARAAGTGGLATPPG
jgi:cholesterol transport system auxiliary component